MTLTTILNPKFITRMLLHKLHGTFDSISKTNKKWFSSDEYVVTTQFHSTLYYKNNLTFITKIHTSTIQFEWEKKQSRVQLHVKLCELMFKENMPTKFWVATLDNRIKNMFKYSVVAKHPMVQSNTCTLDDLVSWCTNKKGACHMYS